MNDLVQELIAKAGITAAQAEKALETIKEYVVAKFPMLEGAVGNMFPSSPVSTTGLHEVAVDPTIPVASVPAYEPGIMDKISDVIPGETGEKIEEFAKNAAHKAADAFESVKEKIGGIFHHDDKK